MHLVVFPSDFRSVSSYDRIRLGPAVTLLCDTLCAKTLLPLGHPSFVESNLISSSKPFFSSPSPFRGCTPASLNSATSATSAKCTTRFFAAVLLTAVATVVFLAKAQAVPAEVIIVRHGEKITDEDTNLSPRGRERAQALVQYVERNPKLNQYGLPVAVFAARPKRDHSTRALETATPLADALGEEVNADFGKNDEMLAARYIMRNRAFNGRTVFMSWVHDQIPGLAEAFGVNNPPDWKSKMFDRTWVIRFRPDGSVFDANEITQSLLAGDSPELPPESLQN